MPSGSVEETSANEIDQLEEKKKNIFDHWRVKIMTTVIW